MAERNNDVESPFKEGYYPPITGEALAMIQDLSEMSGKTMDEIILEAVALRKEALEVSQSGGVMQSRIGRVVTTYGLDEWGGLV